MKGKNDINLICINVYFKSNWSTQPGCSWSQYQFIIHHAKKKKGVGVWLPTVKWTWGQNKKMSKNLFLNYSFGWLWEWKQQNQKSKSRSDDNHWFSGEVFQLILNCLTLFLPALKSVVVLFYHWHAFVDLTRPRNITHPCALLIEEKVHIFPKFTTTSPCCLLPPGLWS